MDPLVKSPWVSVFNSGGCNGCAIETFACKTPTYDIERFGIQIKSSPRHADVLLVTGPVTEQSRERLLNVYEQLAEPKFVVAVGTCAISGGVFRKGYNTAIKLDEVVPVAMYIPGCAPRPEAIIDGILKLLGLRKCSKK